MGICSSLDSDAEHLALLFLLSLGHCKLCIFADSGFFEDMGLFLRGQVFLYSRIRGSLFDRTFFLLLGVLRSWDLVGVPTNSLCIELHYSLTIVVFRC